MEPMQLLSEVGRTICDARTVEIREKVEVTPQREGAFEGGYFRVLFGPNGEYRLETDRKVIVHDGRHTAFWVPAEKPDGPKFDLPAVDTRLSQPRSGPHWRYPRRSRHGGGHGASM